MKIIEYLFISFCLLIITLMLFIFFNPFATKSLSPVIAFFYSPQIDQYICSSKQNKRISSSWREEMKEKIPMLQSKWDREGPLLLTTTSKVINKPFSYSQKKVPVFLCPNMPGLGLPIMVPVRMYLKSAVVHKWDDSEFVDMVFHEILHVYVIRALHFNYWTPLLRKYKNEDFNTRLHLHLFALQKAVYLKLEMGEQWHMLIRRSKNLPPSYSRAISIVNEEDYSAFVKELNY